MNKLAYSIFRSFLPAAFLPLALAFPCSMLCSRAAGAVGVLLGWSGMLVYVFWLSSSLGRIVDSVLAGSGPTGSGFGRPVLVRILFLLLLFSVGAGRGVATFIWMAGTAMAVYLWWLGYLVYWFYRRT